jgi:hypothetical protein
VKFYAGVTDHDWFDYLRSLSSVDEVNFWQPSPGNHFKAPKKAICFFSNSQRAPKRAIRISSLAAVSSHRFHPPDRFGVGGFRDA